MTYRLTGIILRRRPIRETDRLYTVYTRERGKVELLAQGTRKIQSKLAGTLETISILNIQAARGRTFDRLTSAEVIESFPGITSASQISATLAVFALADDLTRGGEQEEALFDLLGETCRAISSKEDEDSLGRLLDAFLWKLLPILGYRPELGHCLRCERADDHVGFDIHGGGVLCGDCFVRASSEGKAVRLSQPTIKALQSMIVHPIEASVPDETVLPIRRLGLLFLAMHGEKPWPARNVAFAVGDHHALTEVRQRENIRI